MGGDRPRNAPVPPRETMPLHRDPTNGRMSQGKQTRRRLRHFRSVRVKQARPCCASRRTKGSDKGRGKGPEPWTTSEGIRGTCPNGSVAIVWTLEAPGCAYQPNRPCEGSVERESTTRAVHKQFRKDFYARRYGNEMVSLRLQWPRTRCKERSTES